MNSKIYELLIYADGFREWLKTLIVNYQLPSSPEQCPLAQYLTQATNEPCAVHGDEIHCGTDIVRSPLWVRMFVRRFDSLRKEVGYVLPPFAIDILNEMESAGWQDGCARQRMSDLRDGMLQHFADDRAYTKEQLLDVIEFCYKATDDREWQEALPAWFALRLRRGGKEEDDANLPKENGKLLRRLLKSKAKIDQKVKTK